MAFDIFAFASSLIHPLIPLFNQGSASSYCLSCIAHILFHWFHFCVRDAIQKEEKNGLDSTDPYPPTHQHKYFLKRTKFGGKKNQGHMWHLTFKQSLRYVLYPARSPITVEDHRISAAICVYMTNLSNFKPGNHIAISGKETGHASLFFCLIFTLHFHTKRTKPSFFQTDFPLRGGGVPP